MTKQEEKDAIMEIFKALSNTKNRKESKDKKKKSSLHIPAEMIVDNDDITINYIVPGVNKEDINIEHFINNNKKEISVSYKKERPENVVRSEIYYGTYEKTITLIEEGDENINFETAKARLENGILTIHFKVEQKEKKEKNKISIE